jgi:hypothetical protein
MTLGIKGKLLDSRMTLKNIARCEKSFKVEPVKTGDTQETKDKYYRMEFFTVTKYLVRFLRATELNVGESTSKI